VAERRSSETMITTASSTPSLLPSHVSLEEVLEVIRGGMPGSSVAEITLLEKRQPDVAVATSQVTSRGLAIPYRELGDPRLDAFQRHVVNRIDSTRTDARWPEFCHHATATGVHSIISIPLVFAGGALGALSLYSETEAAFGDRTERAGVVFAALASAIVRIGRRPSALGGRW